MPVKFHAPTVPGGYAWGIHRTPTLTALLLQGDGIGYALFSSADPRDITTFLGELRRRGDLGRPMTVSETITAVRRFPELRLQGMKEPP